MDPYVVVAILSSTPEIGKGGFQEKDEHFAIEIDTTHLIHS